VAFDDAFEGQIREKCLPQLQTVLGPGMQIEDLTSTGLQKNAVIFIMTAPELTRADRL
jgi:hypothetical protein